MLPTVRVARAAANSANRSVRHATAGSELWHQK
jgi:hypothetical protein